jgi:hypothetical protein
MLVVAVEHRRSHFCKLQKAKNKKGKIGKGGRQRPARWLGSNQAPITT